MTTPSNKISRKREAEYHGKPKTGGSYKSYICAMDFMASQIVVTFDKDYLPSNSPENNPTTARGSSKVEAKNNGARIELVINPSYVLDALSGINADMEIRITKTFVLFTCGTRDAIIMRMVK